MARGKARGGPAMADLFAAAGVTVHDDVRLEKERAVADRFREPSLLEAIREAPALGSYKAVCYCAAGLSTVPRDRTVRDSLAGTAERTGFETIADARDWGRAHCEVFNIFRWAGPGAGWKWCDGIDAPGNYRVGTQERAAAGAAVRADQGSAPTLNAAIDAAIAEARAQEAAEEGEGVTMDHEGLIAAAAPLAPAGVTVDMCRDERAGETYWLFLACEVDKKHPDGRRQIGTVSREGTDGKPWVASRIAYGMPVARQLFGELGEAIQFAGTERPERN